MEFFKDIKNSIYSPKYYQELLAKPFSYSIKYYVLLVVMLSLIVAIFFSVAMVPHMKSMLDVFGDKILAYYPSELKIDIKNGQVSTNVQEPYFVKMPEELKNEKNLRINDSTNKDFQYLLVVDTKSEIGNIEQFKSYNAAFFLTKDTMISYNKNGGISIQPLQNSINFTLDKSKVEFFINKIKPYTILVYPLMFMGVFLVTAIILLVKLIYLFFGALLIWLVIRVQKIKIGYGKSYQLGLHLVTLGIFLDTLIYGVQLYFPLRVFAFFFTVVLAITTLLNIKKPIESSSVENNQLHAI